MMGKSRMTANNSVYKCLWPFKKGTKQLTKGSYTSTWSILTFGTHGQMHSVIIG